MIRRSWKNRHRSSAPPQRSLPRGRRKAAAGEVTTDMGSQETKEKGPSSFDVLPEDVLLEILTLVPATDLILRCRLVCSRWKDIIDSSTLWRVICQRAGYIAQDCRKQPKDWKVFYYLSSRKRNLLQNPCALEKFNHWTIQENGGDLWKVEDLPSSMGENFPDETITKYFVTSYRLCIKSQLLDLQKMGYKAKFMDTIQPEIVIKDWYAARRDCGCQYKLLVQLLSIKKTTLQKFAPEPVFIEQWSDARWHQVTYRFRNYGKGVRYVYFEHGGMDTQFWAGWYGIRVTNSSITIEPEDLTV
ncbi:F-box only protein 44-like [Pyxicephalus adspersus]